jgi:hypothetical protein
VPHTRLSYTKLKLTQGTNFDKLIQLIELSRKKQARHAPFLSPPPVYVEKKHLGGGSDITNINNQKLIS